MMWLMLASLVIGCVGVLWSISEYETRSAFSHASWSTLEYYRCLIFFLRGGLYSQCEYFSNCKHSKVYVYSLALAILMWDEPHYRNGSFQDDLKKNLRNVAVPKTGIPLSIFAQHKLLAYVFLFFISPIYALIAAFHIGGIKNMKTVFEEYEKQFLTPTDWFFFWRLNCALASYHSLKTKDEGYKLEDKLTFLQVGTAKNVNVSPWLSVPGIVCKHRNEEGGLGYKSFSNAVTGGDWIIQETLSNDEGLSALLPDNAPLSTFRVITISTCTDNQIVPLSCVWRAGREGAITDHSAILFDVDSETNMFKKGITNSHWYQLGPKNAFTCPWTTNHDISVHPDNGKCVLLKRNLLIRHRIASSGK